MNKRLIAAVAFLLLVLIVGVSTIKNAWLGETIRYANHWSALLSLEDEIVSHLEKHHKKSARYPLTIDPRMLDFSKTDQATPAMLDQFVYTSDGETYSLRRKEEK